MRSRFAILCVLICFSVDASTLTPNAGCSEIPEVENADVSQNSRKDNYSNGDKLDYNCKHGYATPLKISYICVDNKWTKLRNAKCSLKRCELPEDIPNGQYIIVSGGNFVFGTTIKYICRDGYQMMSRTDTRTCRDGGWDNQLPTCEEITCVPDNTEKNITVEGLPDYDEFIRSGHRLTFSCHHGLSLDGPKQITCLSNGQWSSPFPKCVVSRIKSSHAAALLPLSLAEESDFNAYTLHFRDSEEFSDPCTAPACRCRTYSTENCLPFKKPTCPLNTTVEDLTITRFPDIEGPVKPEHRLIFSCSRPGMKLKGQREITCQSNGEWSSPFPKCEEVTCVANLPANMRSDSHPGREVSVRPGDTITLSCVGRGSKLQGQSEISCWLNGEWNFPFPKCVGGKCGQPPHVEFADTKEMTKPEYNSRERVEYICFNKYTLDQRHPYTKYLTCENGEWRGNIKCLKPCTVTVEEMDKRGIQLKWKRQEKIFSPHKDRIVFACQWGKYLTVNELIQICNDGVMTLPECE